MATRPFQIGRSPAGLTGRFQLLREQSSGENAAEIADFLRKSASSGAGGSKLSAASTPIIISATYAGDENAPFPVTITFDQAMDTSRGITDFTSWRLQPYSGLGINAAGADAGTWLSSTQLRLDDGSIDGTSGSGVGPRLVYSQLGLDDLRSAVLQPLLSSAVAVTPLTCQSPGIAGTEITPLSNAAPTQVDVEFDAPMDTTVTGVPNNWKLDRTSIRYKAGVATWLGLTSLRLTSWTTSGSSGNPAGTLEYQGSNTIRRNCGAPLGTGVQFPIPP